jgi:hypothetical protein
MKNGNIKKAIATEIGVGYDAEIIADALTAKGCYLFTSKQVAQFEGYCKRFNIPRKAVYLKSDDCYAVRIVK